MQDLIAARVLHVLGVVLWIGGVAMVTTVLLPAVREFRVAQERAEFFERIERRFAWQARFTTLLTGLSGFYMLHGLDAWQRYADPRYWWLHLMTLVWLVFTVMLFVLEPTVLKRWLQRATRTAPESTFAFITQMHRGLLTLSLLAVAGAVAGSHGWSW